MIKVNFHTHTERCKHAVGSEESYIQHAIAGGFKVLGFADHTPWPFKDYVSNIRMTVDALDNYITTLTHLKQKYQSDIDIYIGLEVEYFPEYLEYLEILKMKVDYFILGNHFYQNENIKGSYYGRNTHLDEMMDRYLETTIAAINTGLYSYVAHPDLFMRGRKVFDAKAEIISRKIIEACIAKNMPLEYNLEGKKYNQVNGVEEYPHHRFWEIVSEYPAEVIIGVDAHQPESLSTTALYDEAYQFLKSLNIKLIDRIKMFSKEK